MHQHSSAMEAAEAAEAATAVYIAPRSSTSDQTSRPRNDPKPPPVPFLYNRHVLPAALPGMLFITAMTGELLLAILTVGAMIIYLLLSAGSPRNAVIAYICTFIAAQMSALYSCLPLIWISPLNTPLLMILNMFLAITGGWGLLQMEFFIADQPILAQTIETGLFSLYPLVSLALTTWLASYLMSVRFAVYVAIFYGFLLMRIFMTPTVSSFRKLNPHWTRKHVLADTEIGAVLVVYIAIPVTVFFFSHFMVFLRGDVTAMMELALVVLFPPFMSSFIQLRGIYEKCNISLKQVSQARVIVGLAVLSLSCIIVHQSGISAATLWLLPTVICYTLLGFQLSKGSQFWSSSVIVAIVTGVLSMYVIFQTVPAGIDISLVSPFLLSLIPVVNSLAVLMCIVTAGAGKRYSSYLSHCLVLQSVVFVHSECLLLYKEMYSPALAVLTAVLQVYLLTRLNTVSKLTKDCQWIACSVQAMKLPFFIQVALKIAENQTHVGPLACYSSAAIAAILLKVLVYEDNTELGPASVAGYSLFVAASLLAFLMNVIRPVVRHLFGSIGFVPFFLLDLLTTSAVMCKLTLVNMTQSPNSSKLSVVFVTLSSFLLLVQAPVISSYVSSWHLLMLIVAVVIQLAIAASLVKLPHPRLYALLVGNLIGIPLGGTCFSMLYNDPSVLLSMLFNAVSVLNLILILLLWRYSIQWRTKNLVQCTGDRFLHGTFLSFVICSIALYGLEVLSLKKMTPFWKAVFLTSSGTFLCAMFAVLAVVVRIFCLKWSQKDPFSYQPGLLPTYGNLVTMTTYILAILNNPLQFPEIWNSASSVVLLCLQQDSKFFPNLRTMTRTGVIYAACVLNLAIFSVVDSLLVVEGVGVFAVLEFLALLLSLPILILMIRDLSHGAKYVLPEAAVILWAPVGCVLLVFGNSYVSWLLAAASFSSGMWLLQQTTFV